LLVAPVKNTTKGKAQEGRISGGSVPLRTDGICVSQCLVYIDLHMVRAGVGRLNPPLFLIYFWDRYSGI
jgi:hypothetical protein